MVPIAAGSHPVSKITKPTALCALEIGGGNGMINVNHPSLHFLILISGPDDHGRHKEL